MSKNTIFSVVHGKKAVKEKSNLDLAIIYSKACDRTNKAYSSDKSRENLSKSVYYWVKYVNLLYKICDDEMESAPSEYIQEFFQITEAVKELIKLLTPNELMRIFPITKRYDGARYECKDYFTTMEALKAHGLDTPIGETVDHILWDYMDNHIFNFMINLMGIVSKLHRAETGRDWIFDFFEEQGTHLTTYYMATDPKTGKQYMINNDTGEMARVRKPKPRYLKLVQGGEII